VNRWVRIAFVAVSTAWMMIVGVCGVIIVGLWGLTAHTVAAWNENLLLLNPAALAFALLLGPAVYGGRWAGHLALWAGLVVGGSSVVGMLLQVLPWFDQVNGPIVALTVPVNVTIAGAWWWLSAASSKRPAAS
jgi:hypothetical protein